MSGLPHVLRTSWLRPLSLGGNRRPSGLIAGLTIVLIVCGLLAVPSGASAAEPEPLRALPQNATDNDAKWQPALDYDTDGCYNVSAIGPDGTIAQGLDRNGTSAPADCRDQSDLDNSNAYARQRCNSGWCVYLYDYYFEKDVAVEHWPDAGGHVHDWEHIAVWVQNDQAKWVSASQHGGYEIKAADDVVWDGTHPKLVYHKDGASTHNFRFASSGDEPPENHYHRWIRSPLVSYNGFPSGLRDKLFDHDFDHASIAIKDSSYPSDLKAAIPFYVTTEGVSFRALPRGWRGWSSVRSGGYRYCECRSSVRKASVGRMVGRARVALGRSARVSAAAHSGGSTQLWGGCCRPCGPRVFARAVGEPFRFKAAGACRHGCWRWG
ncbi:NPP1 family protein [Streptomyces virginiae]|uniref:NPP1 family protein n=1 Tax=Streptomyces virginiae TaxID=1961 RepID=UPI00225B3F46|nr:NPP1 family protein [Streptomyces virginiae]MCX5174406.1 NPP1 family protein [Streptomyces virginiae]